MKLLTIKLLSMFNSVGDQSQEKDPMILAKFFHPFRHWTRYASVRIPAPLTPTYRFELPPTFRLTAPLNVSNIPAH